MHLKTELTDVHEKKSRIYRRGFSSQLLSFFGQHCLGADTMTKKIFFLRFFENLTKYITNAGYLNTKNSPRLITNMPKWMLTGINLLLFTSQWYLDK